MSPDVRRERRPPARRLSALLRAAPDPATHRRRGPLHGRGHHPPTSDGRSASSSAATGNACSTWSLQAVRAANPRADLGGTTIHSRGPAEELRFRLTEALAASSADPAPSVELTTEQQFATVEAWRLAARAAVLGEHDFPGGVRYSDLTDQQCMTVLKDAADVVRGLIALDRRYSNVPGWEKLHNQGCSAAPRRRDPPAPGTTSPTTRSTARDGSRNLN